MKTSITRLMLLLLLLWLLPTCAELPGFPPPARNQEMARPDESLFLDAEASYRRQQYTEAWRQYHSYLERYPQGRHATEARLRAAELLGLQGNWQGSLSTYQGILARQPEPGVALQARYGIGRAYFKLGQYQEASQILDSLTAAGDLPRSLWFSTQALLAEIALKQNNVPQAFSRLRLAAQDLQSGDHEWFEDLKSRVVEAASPADLESLAAMYRDSPMAAALVLRLAKVSQESGQSEQAQEWFRVLQERYPNSPEAAAAKRQPGGGGKITLGCLLPLSGEMGNVGFRVQRGMELAARQAPVKLVFKDTQNDPGSATQLVQELAQDPQVLAIMGPLTSSVAQTAAAAAQNSGMPLLALSQKADITQTGNLIFQAFLTPRQQVRALVRSAMGLAIQRYAILYPDSAYGRTFFQMFQEELAAAGLELAAQEAYAAGTQDLSPVLTTLKGDLQTQAAATPGTVALFVPDDAAVVAAVAGQLPNLSLGGIQIMGTNLLHNPRVAPEQLAALQGVIFPDAFFPGDPNPAVQEFVTAYRQQYGENPDYLATQGYALVRLMGQLAQSGELDRAALPQKLQALRGTPEVPWFRGFNPQREEEAAIYLLTIKDNQVQMLAPGR
ncbi:MAG: penicillin-binding protein activator [Desulfobaccales bacterium]